VAVALVFLWAGYALCCLGGLWIVVLAWQKGILWELGCLFLPVLQLIYVALNWKEAKSAFYLLLAGFGAFFVSSVIGN
jgi:hypothetical protein